MGSTATLNVRMDSKTKEEFSDFCEQIGISASALMNIFAKAVVRNQEVPFPLTTKTSTGSCIFPSNVRELDSMLSSAEATPLSQCIPASEGFGSFERQRGW